MALLRRLSSSLSEAMLLADFDEDPDEDFRESTVTGASSSVGSVPNSVSGAAHPSDSLTHLGTTTQSLLRTMRLDVVLLGSREEEMRDALSELEGQWGVLEGMLEEQRRTEALEYGAAEADDDSRQEEDSGQNAKRTSAPQCTSTIDWDGYDDEEVKNKKEIKKKIAIRKEEPEQVASQLKNSNFDWGAEDGDGEIQEAAKRASMLSSSGETLSRIVNGQQLIEEANRQQEQNEVPILHRMFTQRDPRKEDSESVERKNNNQTRGWWGGKGRNEDGRGDHPASFDKTNGQDGGRNSEISDATSSCNSKNTQERRGWWGKKRIDDDGSERSFASKNDPQEKRGWWGKNKTGADDKSMSTIGSMSASEKPPTFQIFGSGRRRQFNEGINEDESVEGGDPVGGGGNGQGCADDDDNRSDNPFQRIFQRSSNSGSRGLDASSTNTAVTQSMSHSSDASSSNQQAAGAAKNNAATDDAGVVSALRVKLRGCDSAASTLEQLLSYQTRNLLDLRYERDALRSLSKFDAGKNEQELEKLRNQLHFAKVERRRKARLVEDAQGRMKKAQRQEELLKGELESIRTELFLLNMERTKAMGGSRGGSGDGIGDSGHSGSSHDRVVIVGSGNTSGDMTVSAEWRTGGFHEQPRHVPPAVPDATKSPNNRKLTTARAGEWQQVATKGCASLSTRRR